MNFGKAALRSLLTVVSLILQTTDAQDESRPNFVFIFSDDIGFGDLACYGHPYADTANLDRMAKEGTMYTAFNVNGNVCPHTRAGLMTGRNPSWFPNYTSHYGFMGQKTVTNLLQDAGYHTGHIGKWNIGDDPEREAIEYGIDTLKRTTSINGDPRGREGLRFDDAIQFIEDHQNEPFYLNLWIHAVHTPVEAPQELIDHFENLTVTKSDFGYWMQEQFQDIEDLGGDIDESMRVYLADLYALDLNVGRMLDTLDELGLADNTVLVFSSDNGPARPDAGLENIGYAGGLRGGKHFYYEGGMRVPFIIRWPMGTPPDKVNDSIMFGLDWLSTVCSLAGCDIPWEIVEGEDMSDVWTGAVRNRQTPLFYRGIGTHPSYIKQHWIRYGPWKLVKHDEELYNLDADPDERDNIYQNYPGIVLALSDALEAWDSTLPTGHARFPDDALPFNPNQRVPDLAVPNIDLGLPILIPTRPPIEPASAPSDTPTHPTSAPHASATTSTDSPSSRPTITPHPAAAPTPSPTKTASHSPSSNPTAPTAMPSSNPTSPPGAPTPTPTKAPTVGPDCIQFEDVPFTVKALQYCGYSDTTPNNLGDCGSGEVDLSKGNLDEDMEGFCRSSCYISHTEPNEYVEYLFQTNTTLNLVVLARVASFERKTLSMELVGEVKDSGTIQTDGNGWQTFEEQTWIVASVVPGNHILRVTFIDGVINLCSVSIFNLAVINPTPTAMPGSNSTMAPTGAPRPTPTITPTVGPDCIQFEDLPFTAKALQYCGYSDTTPNNLGDCGFGEVDLRGNLDEDMEEFCQSSCYISHTQPNEYVEYLFQTNATLNLVVSARVASSRRNRFTTFRRKTFSMELVGEDKDSGTLHNGWQTFEEQRWVVASVVPGNHILRVTFIHGVTNLCSVSIRNLATTTIQGLIHGVGGG